MFQKNQFWPLLRYEIFSWRVSVFFSCILLFSVIPFLDHIFSPESRYTSMPRTDSGLFLLYTIILGNWILLPWWTSPDFSAGNYLEFSFTRAMNRTTWFRARTLTFMGLALLPPLISLALSCFHPDLILRGASLTEKKNGITLEACVTGFSGSQVTAPERVNGDYRVRLPQGVTLFAVWEIFLSLVTIAWLHFILRLALSFRNTNSKPWLPWIAYAPFYLFLIWIWLIPKTFSNTGPFHAFLFFSRHWLVLTVGAFLLLICLHQSAERRVSQMEVI